MKLSTVKFQEVTDTQKLSKDEQKLIWGGYTGSSCCFYSTSTTDYGCTSSASTAEEKAKGAYGTWACNTDEAKKKCAGSVSSC